MALYDAIWGIHTIRLIRYGAAATRGGNLLPDTKIMDLEVTENPAIIHARLEERLRVASQKIADLKPAQVMSNPGAIKMPLFEIITSLHILNKMLADLRPFIDEEIYVAPGEGVG